MGGGLGWQPQLLSQAITGTSGEVRLGDETAISQNDSVMGYERQETRVGIGVRRMGRGGVGVGFSSDEMGDGEGRWSQVQVCVQSDLSVVL